MACGQDGRPYVQGDLPVYDQACTRSSIGPQPGYLTVPVGSFKQDQSPHGLADCAGSVAELTQDSLADDARLRWYSGASWGDVDAERFSAASSRLIDERQISPFVGFRLVVDLVDGQPKFWAE